MKIAACLISALLCASAPALAQSAARGAYFDAIPDWMPLYSGDEAVAEAGAYELVDENLDEVLERYAEELTDAGLTVVELSRRGDRAVWLVEGDEGAVRLTLKAALLGQVEITAESL
jgi:hypothetical protein